MATRKITIEISDEKAKPKKKVCSLCGGTGVAIHATGISVPCPNGCSGFYPPHR